MRRAAFLLLVFLAPQAARAGAWTQAEDQWQTIAGLVLTSADRTFASAAPNHFRRALATSHTEYGLRETVTLFAATESAYVEAQQGNAAPFHATDNAVEAGVRWRVDPWLDLSGWGVVSLEASLRAAGAFNFAVSADRNTGGGGGQLRLLYGRSFRLGDRDAFVDIGLGERFLSGGRSDETGLDLTAGLWLGEDDMLMAQSFSLVAPPGRLAAYPAFSSHKLQLSWVRRLSGRFLVQGGVFFSPAGHNALDEQGLCLSLWTRF